MMKILRGKLSLGALAAAAIVGVVAWTQWFGGEPAHSDGAAVTITIPTLSAEAQAGQALFEENCMACHGPHATGSDQGPPLVHLIYEPNHHADISFVLAVRNGVRAHHWPFGNMAPVDGISDEDTLKIIRYVRELQRANGIE